jgi:hypothetical protein
VRLKVLVSASFLILAAALLPAGGRASSLKMTGRLISFDCKNGRYRARIALNNPHDFAQHPHLYVKLNKEGLYESACVELVEYIPEVPPESEETYTIQFDTTCESVVRPHFRLELKRFMNKKVRDEIERWAEECPPKRVAH